MSLDKRYQDLAHIAGMGHNSKSKQVSNRRGGLSRSVLDTPFLFYRTVLRPLWWMLTDNMQ